MNTDASPLGITHVGGAFVVLAGGLVLSLIVAILEFLWKRRQRRGEDKVYSKCIKSKGLQNIKNGTHGWRSSIIALPMYPLRCRYIGTKCSI